MKALSVRAPWAELIASGRKSLETRKRPTRYRGPLVVCQSRGGGAVAVVDLVDCRPWTPSDLAATCDPDDNSGRFVWELRLVRRVTSTRISGRLSFFDVDESLLREV
jgi:hypothetical protein